MSRQVLRRWGSCVALVLALGASPVPAQSPQFPGGVDVVTVDVLVLDQQGKPVEGLTQNDFTLKEDGRVQALTSFEALTVSESQSAAPPTRARISVNARPNTPERAFVIVFDDANLSILTTPHAKASIATFIRQGLRPGDQVMVIPTAGGAWWSGRFSEDRDSLLAYVDRLEGKYQPDSGAARIWDHEALAIWFGRDPQILSYVARRWYENNLIPESYPTDAEARAALQVSPGLAMIRSKAQETYNAAASRLRLTLDTLIRIADAMGQIRGRKNLLLVSEGFIMDSTQPEFRQLVQAARRSNTAVHFLDARSTEGVLGQAGMPGGGAEFGRATEQQDATTMMAVAAASATEGARSVALDTGGSIVPPTAGLGAAMTRIAEQSRAYYLLGYSSANTKRDGAFRKLSVELTPRSGPKLDVKARRGYYAPKDGEQRKPDPERLDPRVRTALDAPFAAAALPLRLTSYTFEAGADGQVPVLLVADADLNALDLKARDGKFATTLETYVVVHARDGGQARREEKQIELAVPEAQWPQLLSSGLPLRREFQLPPGVYQARLLVRDRASGRIGTVRHEFEVGAPKGLRLSTPVLTDSFQDGAPGEDPRPVPVARRDFKPGARLAYAYDVYGAAPDPVAGGPKVVASFSVRKLGGGELLGSGLRPLVPAGLGRLTQVVAFAAPSQPGDYEAVLEVQDQAGGTKASVIDPFTIAP